MERFIRLFGSQSIEYLLADREFVGDKWLEYLNRLTINMEGGPKACLNMV
jgi:hypothetical protein